MTTDRTAAINREELVVTALLGQISSPEMSGNPYEITARGEPIVPVGGGGICYNVRVGMLASGWAADQVDPGISIANPQESANGALHVFACVGNRVTIRTGAAAGKYGVVTGKHEAFMAFQHVLVHVDGETLEQMLPGDQMLVRACGRGMRIPALPDVACHSLGLELWDSWAPVLADRSLRTQVAAIVPPELMGSGSGRLSASSSIEIQSADQDMLRRHNLHQLRLGDLVAIRDWDATYFTGYRAGAVTVGVISHGDSRLSGHGPGITILLSSAEGHIEPILNPAANIAALLRLP